MILSLIVVYAFYALLPTTLKFKHVICHLSGCLVYIYCTFVYNCVHLCALLCVNCVLCTWNMLEIAPRAAGGRPGEPKISVRALT